MMQPKLRKLERQRKILYALIAFCVTIIFMGLGYLVIKLNPNAKIIPKIPTVFVDTQEEVSSLPEDAVSDHSSPADADNTEEPVEETGDADNANSGGNSGTGSNRGGGSTGRSGGNSGGSRGGGSNSGSNSGATGTFGGKTPTGGGKTTTGGNNGSGGNSGSSGGNSGGNSNSGNSSNSSGNTPQAPSQADINNNYRNQIQSKYHLTIKYSDENGDYAPVKRYTPVRIYDANVIYHYLRIIDSALAVYPNGFFPEMRNSGMNLTIYIVKRIGGNISGLTETWNNGYVTIMLQTDDGNYFPETMHHEMMHFIDGYMRIAKGDNSAESRMAALNPPNYSYGDTGSRAYVFTGTNAANAYFISTYGKTNYLEDRATIFADMVTRGSCPAYYTKGFPLNEKAKNIAQQIESHVGVVNPGSTEYWERCIAY